MGKKYYDKVHSEFFQWVLLFSIPSTLSGAGRPVIRDTGLTLTFDNLKDVGTAIETSGPETLTTPRTRNFQSDILKDHRVSPHIWGKLKSSAPTIRERNSEEKKATQGAEEKYEEKESLSNLWKENTFRFLYSRNKNRILFFFSSMEQYHNRTELLKDKVIVTKILKGSVEDL